MSDQLDVLCAGEVLWDALPSGLFLGGAPLNVCYHLNRLGEDAAILSRVGRDRLGDEAVRRIEKKGVPSTFIQRDADRETGFVTVETEETGDPDYEIHEPAAWDFIEWKDETVDALTEAGTLVFGSLAQRRERSRSTIRALMEIAREGVFDVNLREPYGDGEVVRASLEKSDVVKMNTDEKEILGRWFDVSGEHVVEGLAEAFECDTICVTKGENGASLYRDGEWFHHSGFSVDVRDAVGAGDAFLAALIVGGREGRTGVERLSFACAAGALVASKPGATPLYDREDLREVRN